MRSTAGANRAEASPAMAWLQARWPRLASAGTLAVIVALAAPAGASAAFTDLGPFGGTISTPFGVAIAPTASGAAQAVYVTTDTSSGGVEEFTPDGQTLVGTVANPWTCGVSSSSFDFPEGVAVDPATGDLYVTDNGDDRVIEFNSSRQFLSQIGGGGVSTTCTAPDTAGSAPGYFDEPTGLSVGDGELFVAQPGPDNGSGGNTYVDEIPVPLSEADMRATTIGDDGAFGEAVYDPATGEVYAADSAPNNIDVYTVGGTYLTTWGPLFDNGTQFGGGEPQWDAIDPLTGVLYVSDIGSGSSSTLSAVYTFDAATGAYLQTLTLPDGSDPEGIAVDPVNHVLYVALEAENTVERYSYTPAPACAQTATTTAIDRPVAPVLSCSDQSGAPVTYAVVSNPSHGTLSGFNPSTGAVTYTPDGGYDGSDSFTYDSSSINGTGQPSTVSIDVASAPSCAPETLASTASAPLQVTLVCSGATTPASSYRIVGGPAHGSVSAPSSGGSLTYMPDAGFAGPDSFTYEGLSSAGSPSAPETVTIYVDTALPAPVRQQSANVLYASGTVTILLPGQTQPIPLIAGMQVPLGSIVDTTNGRAEILVTNQQGVQHADFYNGEFSIEQSTDTHARRQPAPRFGLDRLLAPAILPAHEAKTPTLYAILDLLGPPIPKAGCTRNAHSISGRFSLRGSRRSALAHIARFRETGKPLRELWGDGHGDFTTVGNGSSSSVRGTRWAIFDYPDGTLTRVYKDSVAVYDFHTHRTVNLVAGHYYFAALGGLKRCH